MLTVLTQTPAFVWGNWTEHPDNAARPRGGVFVSCRGACRLLLSRGPPRTRRLVRIYDMAVRMKTTLNIDDTVMAELKREAARQGRTMSELVETALRLLLSSQ
jgi:hypothetical protein